MSIWGIFVNSSTEFFCLFVDGNSRLTDFKVFYLPYSTRVCKDSSNYLGIPVCEALVSILLRSKV